MSAGVGVGLDRAEVQAFLDARRGHELLPPLLTAAGQALAGQRPVLIASRDAADNAWWIAAVCYLLGDGLARRLTFTTYSHRPAYSPYHLIGTLPALAPPEAGDRFQLFDPAAGRTPGDSAHPLATLLAETGVNVARLHVEFRAGVQDILAAIRRAANELAVIRPRF